MIVTGYQERPGTDTAGGHRHTILFELVPAEELTPQVAVPQGEDDGLLRDLSGSELQRLAEAPIDQRRA